MTLIENSTHWNGRQVLAVFSRVALGFPALAAKHHNLQLRIRYRRRNSRIHGRATVGGHRVTLYLERPAHRDVTLGARRMALVLDHECRHLLGDGHRKIGCYIVERPGYEWAETVRIELVRAARSRPRPTPAVAADTARAHIQGLLTRWQSRERRAKTAIAKYRRKLAYYDRRVAMLDAAAHRKEPVDQASSPSLHHAESAIE